MSEPTPPYRAAALPTVDVTDVAEADELREAVADAGRAELPLEADPADVAEQDAVVPDDDERR